MSVGTVTIQVSPQTAEVLRQLKAEADQQRLSLEVYLQTITVPQRDRMKPAAELAPPVLSAQEKIAFLNDWVDGLKRDTPLLSDEAISRESIYAPAEVTRPKLSPQEKSQRWMAFVKEFSVDVPAPVDDSRESIYTREDEAL